MEEKGSDRMTVRLPKETLSTMDTMLHAFGFENRSEFVRVAVEEYIERRKIGLVVPQKEVERIQISLSPVAAAVLEYLVRQGYWRPEAVQSIFSDVISDWIYAKLREFEEKTPKEAALEIHKLHRKDEDVMRMVRE